MPREIVGDPAGLPINRGKYKVVGIKASSYVLNPRTPYQGEMFFLLGPIEEDDYALARLSPKDEILVPDTQSQEHIASFENCLEHSLHGSFGNQPVCEEEGLFLEQFS